MNKKTSQGFTLIELLVVIGILAILLSITLIAINPARQFGNANNTKRRSAVTQILNALGAYQAENNGQLPNPEITNLDVDTPTRISSTTMATLCAKLVPNYIPALPVDPSLNQPDVDSATCTAGTWDTGYQIMRDSNNRLTISAITVDNGATISVSR
jgi:type IV pilus assembly protein PilA